MKVELEKNFALKLYCYARQAERSVDFAINSSHQWELLCQFYSHGKRQDLSEIVEWARRILPANQPVLSRNRLGRTGLLDLLFPVNWFLNRFKQKWYFPHEELSFIVSTFESFLTLLSRGSKPPASEIIVLRMDFHTCEHLVSRRLGGVPELEKAKEIEHFCQSDYVRHVTLEELLARPPKSDAAQFVP